MPADLSRPLAAWYRLAARDLPWRAASADPWAVLVSEVMLQQTPVARVLPVYEAWLRRWPSATALADACAADAIRLWGKLGYPRRALRLHECAQDVSTRFAGAVPSEVPDLLSLPGIGDYTARAVAVFAFGRRHPVVDTNVRRVVARAVGGQGEAAPPSTARDLATVAALLPDDPAEAARFSIAMMELGALICTARSPQCPGCPLVSTCAWRLAGSPAYDGPLTRPQRFEGTDRQVRGLLLDQLREASGAVPRAALEQVWDDGVQRDRALNSLLTDRLAVRLADGAYALPGATE